MDAFAISPVPSAIEATLRQLAELGVWQVGGAGIALWYEKTDVFLLGLSCPGVLAKSGQLTDLGAWQVSAWQMQAD
jgi:hypothetical protein